MRLFKRRHPETPERRRRTERTILEFEDSSNTFRRGRTLTGSASSLVHAPSEAQADLKSSRVHAHALIKKRRRLTGVFVVVSFVAISFYILVSQFTAHAIVRASPDPSLQLDSVYAETIDDYLGDHIGERWRFSTDTSRLTKYLQATAPEVQNVKLRGSAGFGESLFEITFREPIAGWDINNRQLYVDVDGIPFSRNYFGSPPLRIADQSGMASTIAGQSVMSNRFMSYIGQVIGLTEKQGYAVENIVIPEGMTRQITVHLKGVSYPFKFSSDRLAGEGVDDMIKTTKWMEARQLTPEYVDVRVSGRVFYR